MKSYSINYKLNKLQFYFFNEQSKLLRSCKIESEMEYLNLIRIKKSINKFAVTKSYIMKKLIDLSILSKYVRS